MANQIANPYANLYLKIPKRYLEAFQTYTMTTRTEEGKPKDVDRAPFDRYVDLWWASIGVGVQEGRTSELADPHNFVTGVVLNQEPWRIIQLELLAIGQTGATDILKQPGQVIDIANRYAATGIPILVEELVRKLEPIWDVSNYLRDRCGKLQKA